jgi:hypothetical protein
MTLFIFCFGSVVTVLIGSALTTMIVLKNRASKVDREAPRAPIVQRARELSLGSSKH